MRILPLLSAACSLLLCACGPAVDPATVPPGVLGPQVYRDRCLVCHGATGQGLAGLYPPLAKSEIVQGDKQRVARILLHGLEGPVEVNGQSFNNQMPTWGALHDAEIAAVISFIRTQWGNAGGPITMDEVAQIRAHHKDRGMRAWTMDQLKFEAPVEMK